MVMRREPTAFTRAVAAEIRGLLRSRNLSQTEVAAALDRSQAYVSLRVTGKAAFDTDDVDVLAGLIGLDGVEFLELIARRVSEDARALGGDELSERRGRMRAGQELPHAAYSSDDGISDEATEHDFEP
ncbi:MAG: helix-turn-helix domain-containing protein [Actinobacteria bacterium]|nr:helix-turn-helix domain-containing protein [Actinomycetota bacterium]